jgi:hypothetical protein
MVRRLTILFLLLSNAILLFMLIETHTTSKMQLPIKIPDAQAQCIGFTLSSDASATPACPGTRINATYSGIDFKGYNGAQRDIYVALCSSP